MTVWTLAGLWGGAAALRLAFVAFHFRDLDRLWYDFERGGPRCRLARWLDVSTLGVFLAVAVWALWGSDERGPHWLGKVFVAWLGLSLLARLPVHRFPRTNVPGALDRAKIELAVHLLVSLLGALGGTAVTWAYFRWRG
jgi:hypothetical protein